MVFSSITFLWFFLPPTCLIAILLLYKSWIKTSNGFLLLASILFYAWGEPIYVVLLLVSITINWLLGLCIGKSKQHKKIILALSVLTNLLLLGIFKYANWITSMLGSIGVPIEKTSIVLPIGISFYTFQALSYVIDVYRGECVPQKSWAKLVLYISFFPQLIAGPIVKYKDIEQQIEYRTIDAVAIGGYQTFCIWI